MIKMVRIDHRLLHGQVAFTWVKFLGVDCILIASDSVAEDRLRMSALRMAQPDGVKMVIKGMEDSAKAINSGVTDKYKLLILLENLADANKLSSLVPSIQAINLGGAKDEEGRHQISKAFFVNDEEVKMLKDMNHRGIKLTVQMTPQDTAKDAMSLI